MSTPAKIPARVNTTIAVLSKFDKETQTSKVNDKTFSVADIRKFIVTARANADGNNSAKLEAAITKFETLVVKTNTAALTVLASTAPTVAQLTSEQAAEQRLAAPLSDNDDGSDRKDQANLGFALLPVSEEHAASSLVVAVASPKPNLHEQEQVSLVSADAALVRNDAFVIDSDGDEVPPMPTRKPPAKPEASVVVHEEEEAPIPEPFELALTPKGSPKPNLHEQEQVSLVSADAALVRNDAFVIDSDGDEVPPMPTRKPPAKPVEKPVDTSAPVEEEEEEEEEFSSPDVSPKTNVQQQQASVAPDAEEEEIQDDASQLAVISTQDDAAGATSQKPGFLRRIGGGLLKVTGIGVKLGTAAIAAGSALVQKGYYNFPVDKVTTIAAKMKEVCSGGIFGFGQTCAQVVDVPAATITTPATWGLLDNAVYYANAAGESLVDAATSHPYLAGGIALAAGTALVARKLSNNKAENAAAAVQKDDVDGNGSEDQILDPKFAAHVEQYLASQVSNRVTVDEAAVLEAADQQ